VVTSGVKSFLRPWGWLRSLRRGARRTYRVRPRWRGWTPGSVLTKRYTWAPSRLGLKLRHLVPRRIHFRREIPGPGPFRQSALFFRRKRRRRRRRKVKWRALNLGTRLGPPNWPPLIGGLPPRGYAHHYSFWGSSRRVRNRGLSFNPDRRGSRRGPRRRRRNQFRARPGGVNVHFRQDYLRGLSYLMVASTGSSLTRVPPRGAPRNRLNRGVRRPRRGLPHYLQPPLSVVHPVYRGGALPTGIPLLPVGWSPRRGRPRRGKTPPGVAPPPGVNTLLEGTTQFVGARWGYRRGRTSRVARRRRRIQLVTRGERRGWMFRLPHRKSRGWLDLESRHRGLFVRADLQRVARRRHRRELTFRKRRRSNRIRHVRRKRKKWVPRRVWKLLRRVGRRARRRWGLPRIGPVGLNLRARGLTLYRVTPFFRSPWWVTRQFRPRLRTPRKVQVKLFQTRRARRVDRSSWVGIRGSTRRGRPPRRYLRGRARRLNPRPRRARRRGRLPRGSLRVRSSRPPGGEPGLSQHLGRWFGLFIRAGQGFPRGGREILRTPGVNLGGLYQAFYTPLGSRTRRRGGALLKIPALVGTRQSWSQVRRWFTRGVSTRGDRNWTTRVVHELITPTGVARARDEFIRASLFNRALL